MGSIFKSKPIYMPTSILYMKFHEVYITNMDSTANISVNRRWVYTRAVFKSEPIWLTFISDMYIYLLEPIVQNSTRIVAQSDYSAIIYDI